MDTRWGCLAAGVAVAAAGVIAVTAPGGAAPRGADIALSGEARDIVIDIVRHGQRMPPYNELITPSPAYPGAPLSPLGQQQAHDVADQLNQELGDQVAGIFSGQGIRDIDTAAPFAALEGMSDDVVILPGLDEIDSGLYAGYPIQSPAGLLYQMTPMMWTLFGLLTTPMPGSGEDINGVVFNDKFTAAIDAMYADAMADPVVSDNGEITEVAFNNEASVAAWVALNVKNPDISFLLPRTLEQLFRPDEHPLLPNGGIVEIEGNPVDGWTLVSWDGHPIPQDPGLLTELVMDLRQIVIVEQTASWNIFEAALTGDPATFGAALQAGLHDLGEAIVQFPGSVFDDIADTVSDLGAGVEVGDLAALLI